MAENKLMSFAAAQERETMLVNIEQKENFTTEFRSYEDDAWYTVMVMMDDNGTLRVRFEKSINEEDQMFEPSFFGSMEDLLDFEKRFRPLSIQVQDDECDMLVPDVKVCACQHFGPDELRFYDAVIDSVEKNKHSRKKNAECLCNFKLSWLNGPKVGKSTAAKIGDICIIQPILQLDPVVATFLEIARWRLESQSEQEMLETENHKEHSNANRRGKQSVVRACACSPEVFVILFL
ncbi:uncharacterized protein LOC123905385 [Trifolium pratense]|uniref:uncharacterized protein LOC123905385 n=1 Tax=Trifolium pratense TaxID=57577 RepID=UPI001E6925C5|nr:uncharacterized protein LOC123905385 [Trifolium pratense]